MRLTNTKEIEALLKRGRVNPASVEAAKAFVKSGGSKKKAAAGIPICEYPPSKEPAAILYHALVREFGRYAEGGKMLHEVTLPFTGRKIRLDMAICDRRMAIEVDGWQYHGKYLESFKKDRAKQLLLAEHGWLVVRLSNEQIKTDIENVVRSVRACMNHIRQYTVDPKHIIEDSFGRHSCLTNPLQMIEQRATK